jgi:hypothetical protein
VKIARVIRAIRGSDTSPLSIAHRGKNPQQTEAKVIASKASLYSSSNGQLMNTHFEGSSDKTPFPKCFRISAGGITGQGPAY